jgi:hypothetical protein
MSNSPNGQLRVVCRMAEGTFIKESLDNEIRVWLWRFLIAIGFNRGMRRKTNAKVRL